LARDERGKNRRVIWAKKLSGAGTPPGNITIGRLDMDV